MLLYCAQGIWWFINFIAPTAALKVLWIIVIAGLIGFYNLEYSFENPDANSGNPAQQQQQRPQVDISYTPDSHDVADLSINESDKTSVQSFTLVKEGTSFTPSLTEEQDQAIQNALVDFNNGDREVGFMLIDTQTGAGICRNIDTRIYGASSFKGPYAMYLCESLLDQGQIKKSSISERVENMIIWSDNTSFRRLRDNYDEYGINTWLTNLGVDGSIAKSRFPTYSARQSATIWTHGYTYLNSGTEGAQWLSGLLSKTEESYIRNGAQSVGITGTVMNKAGWCMDSKDSSDEGTYNAVCDAGIVQDGNKTYIISVMTSASETDANKQLVSNLAGTILNCRGNLDPNTAPEGTGTINNA